MKQQTLYLICGPSGAGKSTWCKALIPKGAMKYVSRDEIRFSMLKDGDDYFKYEKKVFKEFIREIQKAIDEGIEEIYADATHLNTVSRMKTLRHLKLNENVRVIPVYFDTPLNLCLERNALRSGRARVPDEVIKKQFNDKTSPIDTDEYEYFAQMSINYWIPNDKKGE